MRTKPMHPACIYTLHYGESGVLIYVTTYILIAPNNFTLHPTRRIFWVTKLSKRKKERRSNKSERGQSWLRTKLYDESNLSSYNIPEFGVHIKISLVESGCLQGSSWTKGVSSHCRFYGRHHDLVLSRYRISVSQMTARMLPFVVVTIPSLFFRSWLIIGFLTRVTRRVSLMEQKLLILRKHTSHLLLVGVRVAFCFLQYWSFWSLSFFFSLVYGFWLPHSYFPTLIFNTFLSQFRRLIVVFGYITYSF